ncbi:hypothetical protein H2201_008595 [Coniosporium apollinis]|uniref:SCP domain-containing protein n=1 Tax=Coniosporium apollinis TaxID=61459 RepID=A0ABQ9NJ00_9PEZI|nr:hypothetical protein H2201_008595 [Coniosporium apollinis]
MRPSTLLTAARAVGTFATPMLRHEPVTEYPYVTVTRYVTDGVPALAATTAAAPAVTVPGARGYWTCWSRKSKSSSTSPFVEVSAPTSAQEPTSVVVPITSETPVATEAPAPSEAPSTFQPPASAPAPSTGRPTGYADLVLRHHNVHRANHSAPALVWNETLASIARDIGNTCLYKHNTTAGGGGYGQNIAAGVQENNISAVITELFYNGEVNRFEGEYGKVDPDMSDFHGWGHFSQIVWKETTQVGCATVDCPNGLGGAGSGVAPYYTVCNYLMPGNWKGQYAKNVGRSLNHPTVYWDY